MSAAMCFINRPFTEGGLTTLAYEEEANFHVGLNLYSSASDDAPGQSTKNDDFVIPAALEEGATTLMAALVTGAAATLLF